MFCKTDLFWILLIVILVVFIWRKQKESFKSIRAGNPDKKLLMQLKMSNIIESVSYLMDVYEDKTYDIIDLNGRITVHSGKFSNNTMSMVERVISKNYEIPIKYKKPNNCRDCLNYELFIGEKYYDFGYGFADLPEDLKNEDLVKLSTFMYLYSIVNK